MSTDEIETAALSRQTRKRTKRWCKAGIGVAGSLLIAGLVMSAVDRVRYAAAGRQ